METGFCRAKHAAHVMSTNFAIFGLGFVAFFLVGFPIMFSGFSYPGYFGFDTPLSPDRLIGFGDWTFLWGRSGFALTGVAYSVPVAAFFLYMVAFMDTTATIPTGAMAERWKWKAFVGWGLFCGALYYPIFGGWTWGGGWLSQLGNNIDLGFGYVDFAGSGVVHAMGGIAGLAGAIVLGPVSASTGPTASPERSRRTTSRWRCSARSSCCSGGSGSTRRRPSRRPTSDSRSWQSTPRSRQRSAQRPRCSTA